MTAYIQHHSFSGLAGLKRTHDRVCEARDDAAERIREARLMGYRVHTLERGRSWEILGPDDAVTISDNEGILSLSVKTYECSECGCEYEDRDYASQCCAEHDCDDDWMAEANTNYLRDIGRSLQR